MLIDDAKNVFRKAWSIKLAILSAVLSTLEVALPFFVDVLPSGTLAGLAALTAIGSAFLRLVQQPAMHSGEPK